MCSHSSLHLFALLSMSSSSHPSILLYPPVVPCVILSSLTCGMGFPYLILDGSRTGSSILLSQIPNESQLLQTPSKRLEPLARRTPITLTKAPPTCGPKYTGGLKQQRAVWLLGLNHFVATQTLKSTCRDAAVCLLTAE